MFQLRDYQTDSIGKVRAALRRHRRVLLQLPTGGGKTVIGADMVGRSSTKTLCYFIVHRQELIDQTVDTFNMEGIDHGIIAAGYRPDPFQKVQICSIDTLKRRLGKVAMPGIVFWDECHHVSAAGWANVQEHFAGAFHVGLTATPERLDGKGLDAHFDELVTGPSVRWLMDNGHLADYTIYAPSSPDLEGVHTRYGEFKRDELEEAVDRPQLVGDAVKHYLKYARGKRALGFAVSVKHSKHMVEQFRAAGVMALHLDGKTPKDERRAAIKAFREGHIMQLWNVGLFGEGFDVPAAECLIDMAPTKSLSKLLQADGRVLRPKPNGAKAIILDHSGNWQRHGFPDDEREWSLKGKQGRTGGDGGEAAIQIKQCPVCFAVHRPAPECPQCGKVYEIKSRKIDEVDGELVELDPNALRRQRNQEQGSARTLDALIELGRKRGYKHPEGWAAKVFTSRQARR